MDMYHQRRHKIWREKVLRQAGYLCQECARYEFPELRYDLKNGRALCAACHNKAHPEKGGKAWKDE